MAPRKASTVEPSTRITRSSTRPKTQLAKPDSPKKKKARTQKKSDPKVEEKAVEAEVAEETVEEAVEEEEENGDVKGMKKIIIEACKQCNSFKTRANQVKNGLEKVVNVVVNPEKPRKGCFEIREEGQNGEKFVSLLGLKRPFKPMKELDMDVVIAEIIEKIK